MIPASLTGKLSTYVDNTVGNLPTKYTHNGSIRMCAVKPTEARLQAREGRRMSQGRRDPVFHPAGSEVQRDSQWRHRVDATQERFCGAASSSIAVISMSRGGSLRLRKPSASKAARTRRTSRSTSTVVHCRQATPGTAIPGLIDTISCQAHHPT